MSENTDNRVVSGFGDEWSRFDQSSLSADEAETLFDGYFGIFPWELLPAGSVGFDLGCGSGRWAKMVAPRVGRLHLIDPSDAIDVARRNLAGMPNCEFHRAGVDDIPLADNSCDFGYSLGVLHHIPDTKAGLKAAVEKLKPGAPFLLYLYYRFDNRPVWYRAIWRVSNVFRVIISRLPHWLRYAVSQCLAALVYWPMARIARVLEKAGLGVNHFPLAQYRNTSFYTMRTDALDRFGTSLERRFTRNEIETMMKNCGMDEIRFAETAFWTAVGIKK